MRRVTINPHDFVSSLREIMTASSENDLLDLAQAFTISGAFTPTTTLNLTSPTAANIAAVLATLITYAQRGGVNRSA